MPRLPATIETERLLLRPRRFEDVDDVLAYAVEEEWSRYMPIPYPYHRADAEAFLARATLLDPETNNAWAIEHDRHVIGGVDFMLEAPTRSASLGYALARTEWNKGFMTEAVGTVVDLAFRSLPDLNRIWAWADARNGASLRVMEKLGMAREGCLRQHRVIRGEFVDAVYCGILRADWAARAGQA